jgi:hypothetical protein
MGKQMKQFVLRLGHERTETNWNGDQAVLGQIIVGRGQSVPSLTVPIRLDLAQPLKFRMDEFNRLRISR